MYTLSKHALINRATPKHSQAFAHADLGKRVRVGILTNTRVSGTPSEEETLCFELFPFQSIQGQCRWLIL